MTGEELKAIEGQHRARMAKLEEWNNSATMDQNTISELFVHIREQATEIERLRNEAADNALSGEAIMLARQMLKDELGIHHAFFDDCIGHAIAMVKEASHD